MPARLVHEYLEHTADRLPAKVALVCGQERTTYHELEGAANQLAHALFAAGVRRGDRVAICLPNTREAVIALYGVLKCGGTFVMLHPSTKRDRLRYILENCAATALITESRADVNGLLGSGKDAIASLRAMILCGASRADIEGAMYWTTALESQPSTRRVCKSVDLDLACLIYTSGSTGEPKGVMCDHSGLNFVSGSILEYLENTEEDILINVLPLSFGYGLMQVLTMFRCGGTLVLEKSFAYPAAVVQRMAEEKVTGLPGVPTLFAALLQMDLGSYDLIRLRYMTNAAAALPTAHIVELGRKFPTARFYSMYGLTEVIRALYLPPEWLDRKPGSVGFPIPGTEVWLEDEAGNRVSPGNVGELIVRGRHVMRGYWNAPEATLQRFRSGHQPGEHVCHTGDLFRMDEEGFLYFVSRKDDIIKSRGEKVAPKEVENVIHTLQGVREAAVVGIPDPLLGQAIKAVVVPADPTLTAMHVQAHCRKYLEDFKIPKVVEFRDDLPKTNSGKVQRRSLAD